MCLVQGPQHSDAGEARTRGPSVLSQALYHWATALPQIRSWSGFKLSDHDFLKEFLENIVFEKSQQPTINAWKITQDAKS